MAVAVLIGVYVAYDQVLSGDSVAPLALPSTSPAPASADPSASTDAGTAPSAVPTASFDGDVAGDWSVAGGSVAGYRVRERLASLSAESDAVGRPPTSGSIMIGRWHRPP
jgi:hypothetical protein